MDLRLATLGRPTLMGRLGSLVIWCLCMRWVGLAVSKILIDRAEKAPDITFEGIADSCCQ
jgi:hypothetical protein